MKADPEEDLLQESNMGNYSQVKKLLDAGAYVDTIDEWEETPLMIAAQSGQY